MDGGAAIMIPPGSMVIDLRAPFAGFGGGAAMTNVGGASRPMDRRAEL